jgi:hypothetical protein
MVIFNWRYGAYPAGPNGIIFAAVPCIRSEEEKMRDDDNE